MLLGGKEPSPSRATARFEHKRDVSSWFDTFQADFSLWAVAGNWSSWDAPWEGSSGWGPWSHRDG